MKAVAFAFAFARCPDPGLKNPLAFAFGRDLA